jgi:DNA-binding LacI/PurR family transcriptional regulator
MFRSGVSDRTKARVLRMAEQLGYKPVGRASAISRMPAALRFLFAERVSSIVLSFRTSRPGKCDVEWILTDSGKDV